MAGTFKTDILEVDTINPRTASGPITIGGVVIEDGTITTTAPTLKSTDPAITALGVDDTDAYAITKEVNVITAGAANTGVELPAAVVGISIVVANLSGSDKKVYATTGDAIDDKTVTTGSLTLTDEQVVTFYCYTTALWQSDVEDVNTHIAATAAHGATGAVVGTSNLQTFITNIKTFMSGLLAIRNPADTFKYIIKGGAIAADRDVTLPLLVGNDVFVTEAMIQTITNKGLVAVAGTVGAPSVAVGAADTGWYLFNSTKTGFSKDGALAFLLAASGINVASVKNLTALGTTPVGTVAITEYGDGRDMTTELVLTNFIIGTLPGVGAALGVGNIVYAFPAGQHFELTSSFSALVLTVNGTAVASDTGLGSVVATGAVATLDGTGTFEDRLTGQTINTDPAGGAAVSALKAATAGIGTGISLNVAASVKNVFLNSAGTWNADNLGNLTATGTIKLKWTIM